MDQFMQRLELLLAWVVGIMTVVGLIFVFFVPIATEVLSTGDQTMTTHIYALNQGVGPVLISIALAVMSAIWVIGAAVIHAGRSPRSGGFMVLGPGLIYFLMILLDFRYIGGSMQLAAIAAVLCGMVAMFPLRLMRRPAPPASV